MNYSNDIAETRGKRETTLFPEAEGLIDDGSPVEEQDIFHDTSLLEDSLNLLSEELRRFRTGESELMRTNDEMRMELGRVKELAEIRGSFIRLMSGHWRTPLTMILTSSHILERELVGLKPDARRRLYDIQVAVRDMLRVFDNFALGEKLDSGSLEKTETELDLVRLIDGIVAETEELHRKRDSVDYRYSSESVVLRTDYTLMRALLFNIVSNAVKFTSSEPKVRIGMAETGRTVKIAVRDNGIGILMEEQEQVWEPFYCAENAGKRAGMGLGLWIARRCAQRLGCRIEMESDIVSGTTVYVKVEKKKIEDREEEDREEEDRGKFNLTTNE